MSGATITQAGANHTVQARALAQLPADHGGVAPSRNPWLYRLMAALGNFRKDMAFFEIIEQMADSVVAAAEQLRRLAREFPDTEGATQLIRLTEREAGHSVRAALARLHRTFLTPYDRQDIHALLRELNAIVDIIATLAKRIPLYHLNVIEPLFVRQTDVLLAATRAVREVVFRLRQTRKLSEVRDKLIEIHHQESLGDDNHHAALSRLFDGTMLPLDVLKWKELYEYIEEAIDRCEDVSNTLTRLVLKGG